MVAYEFLTEITEEHSVLIPAHYVQSLPTGASVRVILLMEETAIEEAGELDRVQAESTVELPSLAALVAGIKQMPPNPNNITSSSGQLGEHLAHPQTGLDADLDIEQWTEDWDRIEADMEAQSLEHEEIERRQSPV